MKSIGQLTVIFGLLYSLNLFAHPESKDPVSKPKLIKKYCLCFPIEDSPTLAEYAVFYRQYSDGTLKMEHLGGLVYSEDGVNTIVENCQTTIRLTPKCSDDIKLLEEVQN